MSDIVEVEDHACSCHMGHAPCGHCEACEVCNCERCDAWHDTYGGELCPTAPKEAEPVPELKSYRRGDGTTVRAQPFGIGARAQMRLADICEAKGQPLRLIDGAVCFYEKPIGADSMGWKFGMLYEQGDHRWSSVTAHIGDYIVELPRGLGLTVMKPQRFVEYLRKTAP